MKPFYSDLNFNTNTGVHGNGHMASALPTEPNGHLSPSLSPSHHLDILEVLGCCVAVLLSFPISMVRNETSLNWSCKSHIQTASTSRCKISSRVGKQIRTGSITLYWDVIGKPLDGLYGLLLAFPFFSSPHWSSLFFPLFLAEMLLGLYLAIFLLLFLLWPLCFCVLPLQTWLH